MPHYLQTKSELYTECPRCGSTKLIRQTGKDEPTSHYGRLKCADCDKHIQWLKDPSVSIAVMVRNQTIDSIFQNHVKKLNKWEKGFLVNIKEQRNLSEKQKEKLNALSMKILGIRIININPQS